MWKFVNNRGGKEDPSIEALLTLIREKDERIEQLIRENAALTAPCGPPSAAEPADTHAWHATRALAPRQRRAHSLHYQIPALALELR